MPLQNLIGSILSLRNEPITKQQWNTIHEYLRKEEINIEASNNIPYISYQLTDYDNYFDVTDEQISISQDYYNNSYLIKKRFFDSLNHRDKLLVYNLINLI